MIATIGKPAIGQFVAFRPSGNFEGKAYGPACQIRFFGGTLKINDPEELSKDIKPNAQVKPVIVVNLDPKGRASFDLESIQETNGQK